MVRIRTIVKLLSSLLLLLGILMLVPIIIIFLMHDSEDMLFAFIMSAGISFGTGAVLFLFFGKEQVKLDLAGSMMLCAIAWLVISVFGSFPLIIGLKMSFADGLFESVSGFTTTGITVLTGLDQLPYSILFWRSFMQWMGGLGILTFFLFISSNAEGDDWQLFSAEGHKISGSRPVPNVYRTVTYFWLIYGGLTGLEILVLWLLKMPLFEALIHSFSTLSTGGFSNHDASIGYYAQNGYVYADWIEYTIILFMFLGGVNFLIHYKTLKEDRLIFFKDVESGTYLKLIFGCTFMMIFSIWIGRGLKWDQLADTFRKVLFQVVSLITSTGFGTEDIGSVFFPALAKQLFIMLMLIGGCVGSTAGGIKVLRIVVLKKLLRREIDKIHLPANAVLPITINREVISEKEIMRISALIFGWVFLIGIGSAITALFSDLGPFEAFSGMTSAVGNMGPFYFQVQDMIEMSSIVKYTYIIGMLAGRLELIPIYVFLSRKIF